ncbi:hypothetical protein DL96DRAFT_1821282 [Flagelloscypha sp. PMI_526]|nr:hypothetical protein DL96DRAFT_1821282 [Flagelloscypha sp. PMI_526]
MGTNEPILDDFGLVVNQATPPQRVRRSKFELLRGIWPALPSLPSLKPPSSFGNSMDPSHLPPELVEHIFGIAAYNGTWEEKHRLLCLSKGTYNGVFCAVFRVIQLPHKRSHPFSRMKELLAFSIWVESRPATLLHTAVHALHIILLSPGQDPEIWRRLFQKLTGLRMLEGLKRFHLDWHMNSLALPSPHDSPLYALRNLTHLTIVPHGHSVQLDFLQRFEALSYLMIYNPGLGYTRDRIASFEVGLPHLSVLLLVFTAERHDESLWVFDQSKKIVTLDRAKYSFHDEYEKVINGGNSLWRDGKDALAKKLEVSE